MRAKDFHFLHFGRRQTEIKHRFAAGELIGEGFCSAVGLFKMTDLENDARLFGACINASVSSFSYFRPFGEVY